MQQCLLNTQTWLNVVESLLVAEWLVDQSTKLLHQKWHVLLHRTMLASKSMKRRLFNVAPLCDEFFHTLIDDTFYNPNRKRIFSKGSHLSESAKILFMIFWFPQNAAGFFTKKIQKRKHRMSLRYWFAHRVPDYLWPSTEFGLVLKKLAWSLAFLLNRH